MKTLKAIIMGILFGKHAYAWQTMNELSELATKRWLKSRPTVGNMMILKDHLTPEELIEYREAREMFDKYWKEKEREK